AELEQHDGAVEGELAIAGVERSQAIAEPERRRRIALRLEDLCEVAQRLAIAGIERENGLELAPGLVELARREGEHPAMEGGLAPGRGSGWRRREACRCGEGEPPPVQSTFQWRPTPGGGNDRERRASTVPTARPGGI